MGLLISSDLEFYEVLNAFPVLKERLIELKFNISDVKEGQSIEEYFAGKSYEPSEIALMIRRLNMEVRNYLKRGSFVASEQEPESVEQAEEEE